MSKKIDTSDINVDEVKAKIREEVTLRKKQSPWVAQVTTPSFSTPPSIFTDSIRHLISQAEANADAGANVSPMEQFSGLIQKLALFTGKVVVYLASFITFKQRSFNRLIINALQSITDNLDRLNNELLKKNDRVTRQSLKELQEQVNILRAELAEIKTTNIRINSIPSEIRHLKTNLQYQQRTLSALHRKTLSRDIQQ